MIFVTVGLHTQPFDRLIREVDKLKGHGFIDDEVVMQIGYAAYEPENCKWSRTYKYSEMENFADSARILVTHGGPSSFMMALQRGKIPIVVPRREKYNEHINDHQIEFARAIKERYNSIIVIEEMEQLKDTILNYDEIVLRKSNSVTLNNKKFCEDLEMIIDGLVK